MNSRLLLSANSFPSCRKKQQNTHSVYKTHFPRNTGLPSKNQEPVPPFWVMVFLEGPRAGEIGGGWWGGGEVLAPP